jgi:hypothetical protein
VPRLTKSDIEQALLTGAAVPWTDAAGKPARIQLVAAKQRRLFAYLRNTKIRDVKGLPQAFIDGLAAANVAVGDPAVTIRPPAMPSKSATKPPSGLRGSGVGGVGAWAL